MGENHLPGWTACFPQRPPVLSASISSPGSHRRKRGGRSGGPAGASWSKAWTRERGDFAQHKPQFQRIQGTPGFLPGIDRRKRRRGTGSVSSPPHLFPSLCLKTRQQIQINYTKNEWNAKKAEKSVDSFVTQRFMIFLERRTDAPPSRLRSNSIRGTPAKI